MARRTHGFFNLWARPRGDRAPIYESSASVFRNVFQKGPYFRVSDGNHDLSLGQHETLFLDIDFGSSGPGSGNSDYARGIKNNEPNRPTLPRAGGGCSG